jgi:cytochrome b561
MMKAQKREYDAVAKSFHWVVVGLLAVQFVLGWTMPGGRRDMAPGTLVGLHMSVGIVIVAVMLARLAWRLAAGIPPPEASLPAWQRLAADVVHWLLYLLVFAMVFTGWSYASQRGWTVRVFGVVSLPALFAQGSAVGRSLGRLHGILAWVLLGTIGVHVAAAFAHFVIWRDGVLRRMLPRLRSGV